MENKTTKKTAVKKQTTKKVEVAKKATKTKALKVVETKPVENTQKAFKSALDEVLSQHKLSDIQLSQKGKELILWAAYEKEGYVRKIWKKIPFNSQKELLDIMKKLTALVEVKIPQHIPQGA